MLEYFMDHLAQYELNCNAETTSGHHFSEVPILKYIHKIILSCFMKQKSLLAVSKIGLFSIGKRCV